MAVPRDPVMLLSYVNTQLRDHYPSLDELCRALGLNRDEIEGTLASIGLCVQRGAKPVYLTDWEAAHERDYF